MPKKQKRMSARTAKSTLDKSIKHFKQNYKEYQIETSTESTRSCLVPHIIDQSLSDLVLSIFKQRLIEGGHISKSDILKDLYEYLIIGIKSTSGVNVEIDGLRVMTLHNQYKQARRKKVNKDELLQVN